MISDEAVEAAADAVFEQVEVIQTPEYAAEIARLALAAAAPHMLSEAKAEGWDAALDAASEAYMDPSSADWMKETNPCRSQT